ncbi:sigma-54-dependent Fis family transcriptional regulator [Candidatus Formimonas warabiya]|nr:sigma-54-dependent Fis family transcriptional regulator [Candidatus Formimonas warabiya]
MSQIKMSSEKSQLDSFLMAWEHFINQGKVDKYIRPVILKSWQRCKDLHVDPFSTKVTLILTPVEFGKLKKKKKRFIQVAHQYINLLYEYVKGSGFVIFLTDENGVVLLLAGDKDQLDTYRQINLKEGAIWSEEAAGTNAVGTSIKERKAVQVVGGEHFCAIHHETTCSASPIFGARGEFIGVLNMSARCENVHSHTLGMVVASAKAIENELKIKKAMDEIKQTNDIMRSTIENVTDGIIRVNAQGEITQINSQSQKILKINEELALGKKLIKIVPSLGNIEKMIQDNSGCMKELSFESKGERVEANVWIQALSNEEKLYDGAVLILQEREKVFQLVNNITGAQASFNFDSIIGKNEKLMEAKDLASKAALTNSTVLLLGESGTGKELFAQAIHNASKRKGPFIAVNCSAIPRSLIESELFGYESGSFTGADRNGRPGKFERANGGTIFLDEIGDMPSDLQAILLRVLQEREVVRVGGYKPIPIDVRVIAATNRDILGRIKDGVFREDLYFRLNVIKIEIPALRERRSDIPLLIEKIVPSISKKLNKRITSVSPEAMNIFTKYHWPGNVRELENILERSILMSQVDQIQVSSLPWCVFTGDNQKHEDMTKVSTLNEVEEATIRKALAQKSSILETANVLGISRSTLYRKMREYNIIYQEDK